MQKIFISTVLFLFIGLQIVKGQNLNKYKYIIVPEQYSFNTEKDKYQLNSLTKFLFNKYGYKAVMGTSEYPEDLKENPCKGLKVDVEKSSTIFKTKLSILLKNCGGEVIHKTIEGISKEKDFKKSYHEALREAFEDIKTIKYTYVGDEKASSNPKQPTVNKPIKLSKELQFNIGDQTFKFIAKEYGFSIVEVIDGNEQEFGNAYKSIGTKVYVINAKELSGIGYFDSYQNLTLERINPVSNKLIKDTYSRK